MSNPLASIFTFSNYAALIAWLVLFCLPFWPIGHSLILTIIVVLLCTVYVYLVFFAKKLDGDERAKGSFRTFQGVVSLFKSPRVVLAGWVHYLAFDLMVGLYIVTDAARLGIAQWMLLPCLLLTLVFGPAGFLLYMIVRFAVTQDALLPLSQ